jgi:hypothetical protein
VAYTQNFTKADGWKVGNDIDLEFVIYANDGLAIDHADKTCEDVSGLTLAYVLKHAVTDDDADAILTKRTGGQGITITGLFDELASANTQRVVVRVLDTDTDDLLEKKYYQSLKRMNDGIEHDLLDGTAYIAKTGSPRV